MKTSSVAVARVAETTAANERVSISSRRVALVSEGATKPAAAPIWEPTARQPGTIPTSTELLNAPAPKHCLAPALEERLIATLVRPVMPDEGHQTGNDNRERELRSYFQAMSPIEAYTVRRRLEADRDDDKLALAFRRLVAERRVRLRTVLADPRRGRPNR